MASAVIIDTDSHKAKKVNATDYPISTINYKTRTVKINEVLPFRVRFTTIGIEAYGANNAPAIPFQVIGFSNYIL